MRTRGFSLIELIIALAVMGVLILAVSPSLSDWMANLRIRNATDALLSGLQQARQEAIRRNQKVSFWLVTPAADPSLLDSSCALSSTSGSWVVSVRSPAGACGELPSATAAPMLVSSHAIGDGASGVTINAMASDGAGATTVEFNGLGSVTNASPIARIDVSASTNASSRRSLRVEITGGGALRMCDPAVVRTDARACKD